MRLTDYQRGSIFGITLAGIAFAFTVSVTPNNKPTTKQPDRETSANAEHQGKSPIERWWLWTVKGESSGFYTFGLIFVGVAQAGFFVWQLYLIREGLSDTQEAADAATEQAKLARESLIASQRAWIKVGHPQIAGELRVNEHGLSCHVFIPVQNVGNSPATYVNVALWIEFFGSKGIDTKGFILDCEQNKKRPEGTSITLFPNERFDGYGYPAIANFDKLKKASVENRLGQSLAPVLMGCVTYGFSSDINGRHQTRFVYHLGFDGCIDVAGAEIAGNVITFRPHHFDGSFSAD